MTLRLGTIQLKDFDKRLRGLKPIMEANEPVPNHKFVLRDEHAITEQVYRIVRKI